MKTGNVTDSSIHLSEVGKSTRMFFLHMFFSDNQFIGKLYCDDQMTKKLSETESTEVKKRFFVGFLLVRAIIFIIS